MTFATDFGALGVIGGAVIGVIWLVGVIRVLELIVVLATSAPRARRRIARACVRIGEDQARGVVQRITAADPRERRR